MRYLLWILAALIPLFTSNTVFLSVMTFTFILGLLAVSFNLIYGTTGQLTLFHAAAFGLGSYATHLSMANWGLSFWVASLFAMLFVALFALIIGVICFQFRLKEFYFAVVTMAFAEIVRLIVLNWHSLTNGSLGINFSQKPVIWVPSIGMVEIKGPLMWYYFCLLVLVLAVLFYSMIVSSWVGRAFQAIRLNEDLATAIGINAFRYKLLSFVLGTMGGSLAGSLYAYYMGFVDPHFLSLDQSLAILSMALLGGTGYVAAPVIGALVLTALPHLIELNAEVRLMVYGVILILTILLLPRGIVGTVIRLRRHA